MAFDITFKSKLKIALGRELSAALQKDLIDKLSNGEFFYEKVTGSKTRVIKIIRDKFVTLSAGRLAKIGTEKTVSGKKAIDLEIKGYNVRLMETGKKSVGSGGGASDAKSTAMQERASMWIIRRALSDNIRYETWKDVVTDPKYRDIVKLYPAVEDNTDWQDGFIAQHKKMLQVAAQSKYKEFGHYSRDKGFMEFISILIKQKFSISQKDTWNPADIWMVENESKIESTLKKSVDKKTSTIAELNAVMRKMFEQGTLIGVSLKKISGKVARWEEVNVDDVLFDEENNYVFELDNIKCNLGLKTDGTFTTTDSRIVISDGSTKYDFQLRQNSPGFSNLKFEPTASGARAARLGKVPLDMLRPMLKEYGIFFTNNWRDYPQDVKEYNKDKTKYKKMFDGIKSKVTTGQSSQTGFHNAILSSFASGRTGVATSKLMQLDFIYALMKLSKKKRNNMLTDMLFLAMKKGANFGPFGKLY